MCVGDIFMSDLLNQLLLIAILSLPLVALISLILTVINLVRYYNRYPNDPEQCQNRKKDLIISLSVLLISLAAIAVLFLILGESMLHM